MQAESKDYVTIILERLLIFHMTRKKKIKIKMEKIVKDHIFS